ncbi:hypothetical protein [Streptosporangium sp. NPDC006007]|uniref:hypothetical protein n=1 Tax=Streptosporangium sp. NPDC006007 TaxID=3154575 RepID=UPI0033A71A47
MSEVVPLPSFGEVFFDERGQERVLRVTWHEGTLVLSLWRGEMCTASFRMPMNDVGRLVDTLDEGFVEAGGQYPDEVDEQPQTADRPGYPAHGEFPGTGQYARPRPEDYPRPPQHPDPATQVIAPPEEPRQAAALSPTDVLVARGVASPLDRSQERALAGYGPADAVPRENMIVNDSLAYGQPQPGDPLGSGPGDPPYQLPGDPYAPQGPDPYGAPSPQPDSYGAPQARQADPYGLASHGRQPDPYGTVRQPDPFAGPSPQPDLFTPSPPQADPFAAPSPGPQSDPYGMPPQGRQPDPYGTVPPAPVDPFAPPPTRQQPVDPFAPHAEQFPASGHRPHPAPHPPPGHSTDPSGFPEQPAYGTAQPDPYGYPAPSQPDPYGFGAQRSPQAGHPADLRDLYGTPPAYEQEVDPSDPLGLRGRQPGQRVPRPYVQDPPHSTGERLRPEQRYDEQRRDDRDERREW